MIACLKQESVASISKALKRAADLYMQEPAKACPAVQVGSQHKSSECTRTGFCPAVLHLEAMIMLPIPRNDHAPCNPYSWATAAQVKEMTKAAMAASAEFTWSNAALQYEVLPLTL